MVYFGYCTLLDVEKMKGFCPKAEPVGVAQLRDYRMCFSSFSGDSTNGGCNLEQLLGHKMWGLLYEITKEEFDALDVISGVDKGHFKRINITVADKKGKQFSATTYVNPNPGAPFRPSMEYTRPILVGARALQLPEEYIIELEQIIRSAQQS
jgi:gamma-glutamylcyclotransferase (GGCT)/AIG2-like uncharacterized protein YtfP